ncbi:MAG: hypothetical protein ACXITV_06510 [Luteibaculaceae bacterium]
MKKLAVLRLALFISFLSLFDTNLKSQSCDPSASFITLNTAPTLTYIFDELFHYTTGVTQVGATRIGITVNNIPLDPNCKWKLKAVVDNNASGDAWEALGYYGVSSAPDVSLQILNIRVTNVCNTPISGLNIYTPHFLNNGDYFYIINNNGIANLNTCNSENINTPGNPLNNFGAYTFTIDYRIIPGFNFRPGTYQISLKFVLEEDA